MTESDPQLLLERCGLGRGEVLDLLTSVHESLRADVDVVVDARRSGDAVIPVIEFSDVATGAVSSTERADISRRGCVIVRDTFDRSQAEEWDRELEEYVSGNRFEERFERVEPERSATGARIWPIYWSRPQIAARQHARMVTVRRFLNRFWSWESQGGTWFDPDHDIGYPDRIRRRAPGVESRGLPVHNDAPSTGGWRIPENQQVFHEVLAGHPERYDPWDAANRCETIVEALPGLASTFRTFQGWTALSDMRPGDGGLHILPIPTAVTHPLVEGLAGELGLLDGGPVPAPNRARPEEFLRRALVEIPAVEPGDTVWWHGDVFHSVADASNTDRWGNVMYIGSSPRCVRNDHYAASQFDSFRSGHSPADYGSHDFEIDFAGRAGLDDLDEVGRQQFGLDPIVRM